MKSKLATATILFLLVVGEANISSSQSRRQSDEEARRQQQEQIRRAQEAERRAQQEYQRQLQEQQRRAQQEALRRQEEEQRRSQQEALRRTQEEQRRAQQAEIERQRRAQEAQIRAQRETERRAQQQKPIPPTQSATEKRVQEEQRRAQAEEQRRAQEALIRQQQEARRKAQQADDQERRKQALQQELARKQHELAEAQKRQARETMELQKQAQQTAPQQQTDLERQRKALQQELARKQKELTELQQRQAREGATKKQQVQQTPATPTQTSNPDIQRLQKDSTIAQSGNYGRTPGGIVDLRTGQIVAPPTTTTSDTERQRKALQQELARKQRELAEAQGRYRLENQRAQATQSQDPARQKRIEQLRREAEEAEKEYQRRAADVKRLERFEKPAKIIRGAADAGVGVVGSKVGPIGIGIEQIYKGVTKSLSDPQGTERREKIIEQWKSKREEERLKKEKWTEDIRRRQEEFNKRLQNRLSSISASSPSAVKSPAIPTKQSQPGTAPTVTAAPSPSASLSAITPATAKPNTPSTPSGTLSAIATGPTPATTGMPQQPPPKQDILGTVYRIPYQNLEYRIPDEGVPFRQDPAQGGAGIVLMRKGGSFVTLPESQFPGDVSKLPTVTITGEMEGAMSQLRGGTGAPRIIQGTREEFLRTVPRQGEFFTQTISPTNPHGADVTSNLAGRMVTSPSLAENLARAGATQQQIATLTSAAQPGKPFSPEILQQAGITPTPLIGPTPSLTAGGTLSTITAGPTPATIGVPAGTALSYGSTSAPTRRIPSSPPLATSSSSISAEDMAQMQQKLQTMKTILATAPPTPKDTATIVSRLLPGDWRGLETQQRNWQEGVQLQEKAKTEISRAEQALKSGDVESYKRHLDQSRDLTKLAADKFSNEAYRSSRALTAEGAVVPAYGNWGGQGWSGGWNGKQAPINKMDEAFKRHDEAYGAADKLAPDLRLRAKIEADKQLVADLEAVKPSDLQGKTYFRTLAEDDRYRKDAVGAFTLKILSSEAKLEAQKAAPVVGGLADLTRDMKSKQLDKVPEDIRQLREATTGYMADKMGSDPNNILYRGTNWMDKPGVQRVLQANQRTLTEVEKIAPVISSGGSVARDMWSGLTQGNIAALLKVPEDITHFHGATTQYFVDKMGPDPTNSSFYRITNWVDNPAVQRILQPVQTTLTEVEKSAPVISGMGKIIRGLQDLVD